MKVYRVCGIVFFSLAAAGQVAALDCSQQINEASTAVEAAGTLLKTLPAGQRKKEVHMLVDDAKMYLHGAEHNQEKPQGDLDIARCMAKSGAALGYAEAAKVLAGEKSR